MKMPPSVIALAVFGLAASQTFGEAVERRGAGERTTEVRARGFEGGRSANAFGFRSSHFSDPAWGRGASGFGRHSGIPYRRTYGWRGNFAAPTTRFARSYAPTSEHIISFNKYTGRVSTSARELRNGTWATVGEGTARFRHEGDHRHGHQGFYSVWPWYSYYPYGYQYCPPSGIDYGLSYPGYYDDGYTGPVEDDSYADNGEITPAPIPQTSTVPPPEISPGDEDNNNYQVGMDWAQDLRREIVTWNQFVEYVKTYVLAAVPTVQEDFHRGFVASYGSNAEAAFTKVIRDAVRLGPA